MCTNGIVVFFLWKFGMNRQKALFNFSLAKRKKLHSKIQMKKRSIHMIFLSWVWFETCLWQTVWNTYSIHKCIASFSRSVAMKANISRRQIKTEVKWAVGIQPRTQIVNVPKQLLFALTFAKLNFALLFLFFNSICECNHIKIVI